MSVGLFWVEVRMQSAHDHRHVKKDDVETALENLGLICQEGNQPQQKHGGHSMGVPYSQNRINIKVKPVGKSITTFITEGGLQKVW